MRKKMKAEGSAVATAPTNPAEATAGQRTEVPKRTAQSEEAIRLRAYQKWEAAGKPPGDGVQFWMAAEQELAQKK